jgi:hypothetical protein
MKQRECVLCAWRWFLSDFYRRGIPAHDGLVALRLALAAQSTGVRADDSRRLRHAWHIFAYRCAKSFAASQPDLVHGLVEPRPRGIMTVQAINAPAEHGHLMGDIPALAIVAIVLAVLTPRGVPEAS